MLVLTGFGFWHLRRVDPAEELMPSGARRKSPRRPRSRLSSTEEAPEGFAPPIGLRGPPCPSVDPAFPGLTGTAPTTWSGRFERHDHRSGPNPASAPPRALSSGTPGAPAVPGPSWWDFRLCWQAGPGPQSWRRNPG